MTFRTTAHKTAGAAVLALALAGGAGIPAWAAQSHDPMTTEQTADASAAEKAKMEISEAMDAIGDYTAEQREDALAAAREAMQDADAQIDRIDASLRDNWGEMSEEAREKAQASLHELREARYALSERYGELKAGASDTWDDLKAGFASAWSSVSQAWDAAWDSAFDEGPAEEAGEAIDETVQQ